MIIDRRLHLISSIMSQENSYCHSNSNQSYYKSPKMVDSMVKTKNSFHPTSTKVNPYKTCRVLKLMKVLLNYQKWYFLWEIWIWYKDQIFQLWSMTASKQELTLNHITDRQMQDTPEMHLVGFIPHEWFIYLLKSILIQNTHKILYFTILNFNTFLF